MLSTEPSGTYALSPCQRSPSGLRSATLRAHRRGAARTHHATCAPRSCTSCTPGGTSAQGARWQWGGRRARRGGARAAWKEPASGRASAGRATKARRRRRQRRAAWLPSRAALRARAPPGGASDETALARACLEISDARTAQKFAGRPQCARRTSSSASSSSLSPSLSRQSHPRPVPDQRGRPDALDLQSVMAPIAPRACRSPTAAAGAPPPRRA